MYFINRVVKNSDQFDPAKTKTKTKKDKRSQNIHYRDLKYAGPFDKLSVFHRKLRLYIPLYKSNIFTDTRQTAPFGVTSTFT